jgi:diacylglycerol kinase family enzyme
VVDRVLLIVNTTSGTGRGARVVAGLRAVLDAEVEAGAAEVVAVADHADARRRAHAFAARTPGRCAVVVAGGNGTVRAAVEGIAAALGPTGGERVVLAALRLGSGNLFARHFGAPADPEAALRGILANLRDGRLTRCGLVRCDVEDADGGRRTLHATSLVAFGALGRVPSDLARWHGALPRVHRALARALGIERLTRLEYALAFALRAARAALSRGRGERLRVVVGGRARRACLLAGAIAKLDVPALPLRPRPRPEEPALSLALLDRLPLASLVAGLLRPRRLARRARVATLGPGEPLRLETAGGAPARFFLDEDPESFGRALTVQLAGPIPVAPGPDYRWPVPPQEVA